MRIRAKLYVLLLATLIAAGCGDSATGPASKKVSQTGGTVALEGSATKLAIPENALTAETEITITPTTATQFAPLSNAAAALSIEPAGTSLAVPASLTIEVAIPADKIVKAHRFTDGVWIPMSEAVISANLVTVALSSLAPVAVTIEDKPVLQLGNRIDGTAVWGNNEPAANVPVELWQSESKLTSTTTDSEGRFSFGDLSAGAYTVVVPPAAECPAEKNVTVTADAPTTVNLVICGSN